MVSYTNKNINSLRETACISMKIWDKTMYIDAK